MNYARIITAICILSMFGAVLTAQPRIIRSVMASGAVSSSAGGATMYATIGQVVTGLRGEGSSGRIMQGFWYSLSVTTSVNQSSAQPAEVLLHQNYPNPFNPSTIIEFSIPAWSHVTLEIYDKMGRKVEDIVDEMLDAGSYSVVLDAREMPSGMYVYRLRCGERQLQRKMMLLR